PGRVAGELVLEGDEAALRVGAVRIAGDAEVHRPALVVEAARRVRAAGRARHDEAEAVGGDDHLEQPALARRRVAAQERADVGRRVALAERRAELGVLAALGDLVRGLARLGADLAVDGDPLAHAPRVEQPVALRLERAHALGLRRLVRLRLLALGGRRRAVVVRRRRPREPLAQLLGERGALVGGAVALRVGRRGERGAD